MKKIISVIASASLSAAIAFPAFAASFTDIAAPAYSWAVSSIESMSEAGYITGYEDGTFRPDSQVTRLECIALFARAMGSNDEVNAEILQMAHEQYDSILSAYSLPWGEDEIAYLLYTGTLSKTDLDRYIISTEKDEPMKRCEAAVIITKALGGESEALGQTGIVLDYNDAKEIPSDAVQYVYYATKAGIMNGMGDGSFSPLSSVSRAQMAVMLERTVDATDYSFFKAKLASIDTTTKNVTYTDSDGNPNIVVYTDDTAFRVLGVETQARIMTTGVQAIFGMSGEELISVDALSEIPDETVVGVYTGYSSNNGVTSVQVKVNNEPHSYDCAKDVSVTYAGAPATIRSFKQGDAIELWLTDGKITKVIGSEKEVSLPNVIIEDVIIDSTVSIKISSADEEYDGKTFPVASTVGVTKNGKDADLTKIYAGDTATLTLQYGEIKKISAKSTSKTVDGIISSITIASPNSSMTVNVKGEEKSYTVPADAAITINGQEGTLYDFRVGDTVKITTESNAITKIVANSTQVTAGSTSGVVSGVTTGYKLISINTQDSGSVAVIYSDKTMFVSSAGAKKTANDIKAGQTISVRGTVNGATLVADLIIIESEAPAN